MAVSYLSNSSSSSSINQIDKALKNVKSKFEELSSGKKINKASDDAAGLAIAKQLEAEGSALTQASRNISDAVSEISIADGALESASDISTRMNELAVQSANGSLSDEQRTALNDEFQSLKSELDRISNTTSFNGNNVFGSSTVVQSGTDGSETSQTEVKIKDVSAASLGVSSADISTQAGAQAAMDATKAATKSISENRGDLGASESKLQSAYENIQSQYVNTKEAQSRIEDADIAQSSSELAAAKIRQDVSVSLSASQNKLQGDVALKLLG